MEVVHINGVPTHVFTVDSPVHNDALVLVIPGSPGMGHFYIPFASRLYQLGNGSYDVAVVSHAGHSPGYSRPLIDKDGKDWYSLEDQVAHKMAYLQEHAPHKENLYLVGHSIGCYMILKLLERIAPDRVRKIVLLFPTIERMAETPNGRALMLLFTRYLPLATWLTWLASWVPDCLKGAVLRYGYFCRTPPDHAQHMVQAVVNIDSMSIYNVLNMARQEMEQVRDPPLSVIDCHGHKMALYYGTNDRWTLDSCFTDMAQRFPEHDIRLCDQGYEHAFVISASAEMADYVFSKLLS